jgi:hypothetical protein
LSGAHPEDLDIEDWRPFLRAAPSRGETYVQILTHLNGRAAVEVNLESKPAPSNGGTTPEGISRAEQQYSAHA